MVGSCTKILSRDFAQAEFISRIKVVNVLNQLKGEEKNILSKHWLALKYLTSLLFFPIGKYVFYNS